MRTLKAAMAVGAVAASSWLPSCSSFGAAPDANAPSEGGTSAEASGAEAGAGADADAGVEPRFCAGKTAQVCVDFEDKVIRSAAWTTVDQSDALLYPWTIGANPKVTNHYLQIPLPPESAQTLWKNAFYKALPVPFPATVKYGLALKVPVFSGGTYVELANLMYDGGGGASTDLNVSLRWDGELEITSGEVACAKLGNGAPTLERFDFEVSLAGDPWLVVHRNGTLVTLSPMPGRPTTVRPVRFGAGLPYSTMTHGEAFSVDDIILEWQ